MTAISNTGTVDFRSPDAGLSAVCNKHNLSFKRSLLKGFKMRQSYYRMMSISNGDLTIQYNTILFLSVGRIGRVGIHWCHTAELKINKKMTE